MLKRILFTVLLFIPSVVFSGAYTPGTISIGTRFDGATTLAADYNVRYNSAAPSSASVMMTFYGTTSNPVISITAYDGNGKSFWCYINSGNPFWTVAQEGMRAAGNGARIQAAVPHNSSNCDNFVFYKTSNAQD